eukprot:2294298-Pyramimonas_sp.AAC.1
MLRTPSGFEQVHVRVPTPSAAAEGLGKTTQDLSLGTTGQYPRPLRDCLALVRLRDAWRSRGSNVKTAPEAASLLASRLPDRLNA